MTILELLEKSGDSRLIEYCFGNGVLIFRIVLDEDDRVVNLHVVTDTVTGCSFDPNDCFCSTGFLESYIPR
jgi:hypothetical protein